MKKIILSVMVVIVSLLIASSVYAQSNNVFPPVDLPADHWAYDAIQALYEAGVLEGYPGNEFLGSRTLTRYEFAIAIYRIINYLEGMENTDAATVATVDALKVEFTSELADIQAKVDANSAAIDDLSASLTDLGTRVDNVEKKLGNISWDGDFRFRLTYQDMEASDMQRFRERMRLRLNFKAPIIEDQLNFYGRLATGTGGTSTNQTLGSNFTNYGIGIDLAYLDYQPTWIPWATHMYAGRFKNFLDSNPGGIIWCSDLNFDGTGEEVAIPQFGSEMLGTWKFNAIQGIMNENGAQAFENEDDEWMLGWQVAAKDFVIPKLNWFVGYYHYQNIVGGGNNFVEGYNGNLAGGDVDVNLDGAINNLDSLATKYDVLNIGANYEFQLSQVSQPIFVHADYVANLNPEIPFAVDTRFGVRDEDHIGWQAGFRYGNSKTAGTWDFGYIYKDVGATAVVGNFADPNFYGANVKAHNFFFDYAITDNTSLKFNYFIHDLKNDLAHLPNDTHNQVNLDLTVKF
jgi:hypothetical protein